PHLRPDAVVLDVGCGPGTITVGLARRAGRVVGLDMSAEMVESARSLATREGVGNATFEIGSAYELPFEDVTFDVVYAHQVLQHLADPVAALTEFRRVLRPGGLVAVRDSDYATMIHAPVEPAIERWRDIVHQVQAANGGEADAGRYLPAWVRRAGFVEPTVTTSSNTFADPETRAAWGDMWAVRATESDFADHATAGGFATRADLEEISTAFKRWVAQPDGFWAWLNGEVVAKAPPAQPNPRSASQLRLTETHHASPTPGPTESTLSQPTTPNRDSPRLANPRTNRIHAQPTNNA
ncbi:MAG: methyltransferase domain-containing protein, partial [bacterium]|nr:methyltransferase domain-containing protein [bacterium]